MTKFVILSEMRTGGTVLADALGRHPQVTAVGEILDAGPSDHWRAVRRSLLARLRPRPEDVGPESDLIPLLRLLLGEYDGFMVHRDGQIVEANPAWDYLVSRTDLAVIHLYRENLFRQYLSEHVALATGIWHLEQGDGPAPADPVLWIDPADCLRVMRDRKACFERLRDRFAGHRSVTVRYEDLAANMGAVLAYCQGFLGVDWCPLPVTFRRRTPQPTAALVANLAELRDRFAGTEFAGLLDD